MEPTSLEPVTYIVSVLWALCAGGLAWYAAVIARQMTYVTLADGRRQQRSLPMLIRLVLPLAPTFAPLFDRPAFRRTREKTAGELVSAGFDGLLSDGEFMALRILMPGIYGVFWCGLVFMAMRSVPDDSFMRRMQMLFHLAGLLWFAAYPGLWLHRSLQARHRSIQKSLPFILDLLTLSVEAGMDFMSALQRCVERRQVDALGEELIRVIRGIQLGKTRRDALREMSQRVNLPSLRSVVHALIQADELGVSVGYILRIQSDQIRLRRFERAEKLANEAPVKMLFPLMFFIFPAVFLILLGPVIYRLLSQGLF
ncbi:MAG: type II secretion system F family protein [Lentisphaerae bacterium]|nr:type II secretion system F family protein [Lentisphaerota bacterium]